MLLWVCSEPMKCGYVSSEVYISTSIVGLPIIMDNMCGEVWVCPKFCFAFFGLGNKIQCLVFKAFAQKDRFLARQCGSRNNTLLFWIIGSVYIISGIV